MIETMAVATVRMPWIEDRIRVATGDRVRGLRVEREEAGRVRLQGRVASRHTKQLALHAALSLFEHDEELCVQIGIC